MQRLAKAMKRLAAPRADLRRAPAAPLRIAPSVQDEFLRSLIEMLRQINAQVVKDLQSVQVADAELADAAPRSLRGALRLLAATRKRASDYFATHATPLADRWLARVSRSSRSGVTAALKQLGVEPTYATELLSAKGQPVERTAYDLRLREAVELIRSIPTQHFDRIEVLVHESIEGGKGVSELMPKLQQEFGITERRAKLIAYDQTRKAFNSINIEKMTEAGVPKWMWIHSGG